MTKNKTFVGIIGGFQEQVIKAIGKMKLNIRIHRDITCLPDVLFGGWDLGFGLVVTKLKGGTNSGGRSTIKAFCFSG